MKGPHASARPAPVPVGYILKMFPRLSETFILNEVLELEAQGLPLHIFSLRRPVDSVAHAQAGAVRSRVTYLPETIGQAPWSVARGHFYAWRHYPEVWRRLWRNSMRRARSAGDRADLLSFCQACCIIRGLGSIGHLHAHYANVPAKIALLVHRLTGISYSITTHAKDIFQNDPFGSPKLRERMHRARFVVANSHFSAEHIRAGLKGQGEIRVVHNGLDLRSFPLRSTAPQDPLILTVGRLVEKKGFPDLIAACQLLKEKGTRFECEIVGTGALSNQLKEQIRVCDVADRVRLLGPLPQQVLREHYARAMIFALPCRPAADGDRDILPNVVKEAMAVGVPVVTTRLEAIDELIEDGVSGILTEPGNVQDLASKLESVLEGPELRERLARNGRRLIQERFDRRSNFAQLKALLQAAAQGCELPVAETSTFLEKV